MTIGDVDVRVSTLLGYAGAYSVTLSTTLPEFALELHSVYLGHAQTPTSAAHLVLTTGARTVRQLQHNTGALPVAGGPAAQPGGRGRGALLLDHLGELQAAISRYLAATQRDASVRVESMTTLCGCSRRRSAARRIGPRLPRMARKRAEEAVTARRRGEP